MLFLLLKICMNSSAIRRFLDLLDAFGYVKIHRGIKLLMATIEKDLQIWWVKKIKTFSSFKNDIAKLWQIIIAYCYSVIFFSQTHSLWHHFMMLLLGSPCFRIISLWRPCTIMTMGLVLKELRFFALVERKLIFR